MTSDGTLPAKKSLGQNFCTDARLPAEIVRRLAAEPGDAIWEIGPGTGALTEQLIATGAAVSAFEIDTRMGDELARFGDKITIHWGDVLEMDPSPLIPPGKRLLVTGNLPYYCGTAILRKLLMMRPQPDKLVFLLQDEVARKAAAKPATEAYGFLSAQVRLFAEPVLGTRFSPASFRPSPKVYSTILELRPLKLDSAESERRENALKLLSVMLGSRRKMALPLLRHAFPKAKPSWDDRFIALDISTKIRGETLPLETVISLAAQPF
ncbi:MAG TPA: 16S rRNA (adenine(1518)-N(6)/adenine(1519)-N(6))-dimethyltransferase RsmA [Candidatus Ozemobacteraceae bacterium]|nr:16S rRNA (adenine(1518)-N(6)/adenine(1519)-N(6))-dimethyltransferase RsmA [Candidatus Ozemobacteraceae bacterium]